MTYKEALIHIDDLLDELATSFPVWPAGLDEISDTVDEVLHDEDAH